MPTTYVTTFPDGSIVRWKPLAWDEYRALVREFGEPATLDGASAWSLHYSAALLCVLDQLQGGQDVEFDDLYAGTINTVGRQILEYTGFSCSYNEVTSALGAARERLRKDFYESALAMVCVAFSLKPEEVRQWDRERFLDHVAMVELATGQEISLEDPNEKKKPEPTRFIEHEGRRVPVLTQDDLTEKRQIDIEQDNRGLRGVDGFDPRLRGLKKTYG